MYSQFMMHGQKNIKSSRCCVSDKIIKIKYNVYSVENNNIFIALLANSFGRYYHNQANAIQNLKRLVTGNACHLIKLDIFMPYM